MNALEEINSLQEKWGGLIKNLNLPKSYGKYDDINKGLVFYLSDLHIETNIPGNIYKENIIEFVDMIVKNSPELYAIIKYNTIKDEADKWGILERRLNYNRKKISQLNEKDELTKEEKKIKRELLKEEKQLNEEFNEQDIKYKKLEKKAFKDVSDEARKFARTHDKFTVVIGGDISNNIEYATVFYHRLRKLIPKSNRILAVLGNHELSQFSTVKEAVSEYQKMFSKEDIIMLQNNGYAGFFGLEDDRKWAKEHGISKWSDDRDSSDNLCFFGGVGFNRINSTYNANSIITSADLQGSIEEERKRCDEFVSAYKNALDFSQCFQKVLVVISHYPIRDWMNESECDNSCYYFYGHNHKNELFKSNGAYIFADNQIGYHSNDIIKFKHVELLGLYNPFYMYEDGVYSIYVGDYELFYKFTGDGSIRSKNIWKYVDNGYELKMIKKNGYYGFFIVGKSKVFICKGGKVEGLKKDFDYYCNCFEKMVIKYIEKLAPFRNYQVKLAEEIKNIGGLGKIHGLIVDYDYCHHVMISPVENKLFFYYSPEDGYGTVLNLKNVKGLLGHVDLNEITKSEYLMSIQPDSILAQYVVTDEEIDGENDEKTETLQHIKIKESPYVISIRMRNLERIFTSCILRDWDDKLIADFLIESN